MRSPDLRSLTSISPLFRPLGPTISWNGRPIRSMVANLAPARSSRVVVEHRDAGPLELAVEVVAGRVGVLVARLEVDEADLEGRDRHRPDDAGLVVARLDDGADQPRHADAVGAHLHRDHASRPAPAPGTPWARNTWCRRRKCGRPRCRGRRRACRPAPRPRSAPASCFSSVAA